MNTSANVRVRDGYCCLPAFIMGVIVSHVVGLQVVGAEWFHVSGLMTAWTQTFLLALRQ